MKVQVEKAVLVQTLQKVQHITEKKSSMPILSNVLIKCLDEQRLEFLATDLELKLWTQIGAQVDKSGSTTVSARKLLEIARELPQDHILFETLANDRLAVTAGRTHFELATIPWEDFPHISVYENVDMVKCDVSVLKNALSKTLYGIPADDDPFSIAGLFIHTEDPDRLRFVSSDGHRLSYVETSADNFAGLEIGKGIVIPRKGVQEIVRILEKESEASLGMYENSLILKTDNAVLSVQLLESEFPEYQLIIPDERPFSFVLDWESLFQALKRMAVLTDQKWRYVRFIIKSGSLELQAGNQEIGTASDILDIDYEGEDFTVAFNIRYVLDSMQVMESRQVRFEWVDYYHGGIFLGLDDPGYFSLIMPMVV